MPPSLNELADDIDLVVGILRADIGVGFRPADPRVTGALDRLDSYINTLREEHRP